MFPYSLPSHMKDTIMNIRIYGGLWKHSDNPAIRPVFEVITGTLENGVYTQFPGYDAPFDTTVAEFYAGLPEDDCISLTQQEMETDLAKSGVAYYCGCGHGAYMVVPR